MGLEDMVTFRALTLDDRKKMKEFFSRLGEETLYFWKRYEGSPEEMVESLYRDWEERIGSYFYVLEYNGEIIALTYLATDEKYPDCPSFGVVVRDDFQGKGLGSFLTKRMVGLAIARGYRKIYLTTHPDNRRAIKIYESLGFKKVGECFKKGRKEIEYRLEL